jgi:hypothetical protein
MKSFHLSTFCILLIFSANSCAPRRMPVVEQLARTYGIDSWGQVDAIRYTFNIQIPGLNLARSWEWQPKTGQVTYEGKDKDGNPVKVTYQRSQLSSQTDAVKNDIDPGFVNDNYWFLLPFHVYWDTSAGIHDRGQQQLPLGTGTAHLISVKYPTQGGYTPGDIWDLYIGNDGRIQQFVYHRGGPKMPRVVTATWESHKKAGPLLVATEHHGTADGGILHVFFSDVAVKLSGSANWLPAQ